MIDPFMMLRVVIALLFVLSLIGIVFVLLRRHQSGSWVSIKKPRRIRLVESLMLDNKHRAILLERDQCRYFILLGGAKPIVLDQESTRLDTHDSQA
ncbi:MAG: flagellar biosynthetic protein FliO [Alphaproteobacteria bacterium]|nr:flagellar biosynthetic protein FliO [Alphaproteobacteria bacterium]